MSHGLLVNALPEVGWPPVPICPNWAVPRMWDFLCFNPNRDSPRLTTELLWIASAQQSALKPALQEIILNTQKPNIHSTSYRNGLLKELETSFERWSKRGFSSVWVCWIVPDVEVEQLPPSLQPRWHQRRCSFILGKKWALLPQLHISVEGWWELPKDIRSLWGCYLSVGIHESILTWGTASQSCWLNTFTC